MAQSYTATREMLCSEETEIQVSVQWKYTVTPGCAQTLTQPEEDASLDISRVRVSWGDYKSGSYCWHENPALVDLATEVFGGDEAVEAWLMEQANESAEASRGFSASLTEQPASPPPRRQGANPHRTVSGNQRSFHERPS